MLTVSGLTKTLALGRTSSRTSGRTLFSGLDFALASGEFVAIMGESGVGKSTLLNLIAGLETADSGSIVFDGKALESLDDDARTLLRRRHIGFVFQAFHLLPHLTLAHNVALPLVLAGVAAKDARRQASGMLDDVGLGSRGNDFPRTLSGGELQRVAIARALVHRPRLVLADEPTGNLDPDTAARVIAMMRDHVRGSGAAMILVTHSELAAQGADRTMMLGATGLAPAPGTPRR